MTKQFLHLLTTSTPLRILFFLEYYHPNIGGVETLFKNLVDSLAAEGHHITILTARPYPTTPLKEVSGNVAIFRIPVRSRYVFTFLGFFYLLKHIRKADLVHTTSYNAAIPAFFASQLFGKKVVVTFHEVWDQLWFQLPNLGTVSKWGHYLFEQFLLKLPFNKFIGVSHSTANRLRQAGIAPDRVITIYNGLTYQEFTKMQAVPKIKKAGFVFTYFGRLGISKGLDLLLPAAVEICQQYPDVKLQLIIPKVPVPFLTNIKQIIQSSILKDHIILQHELPFEDLKYALVQSDAVVIPSYSEGFCFAAAECVAMGVPLISSDRAALKEVVSGQFIKMTSFSKDALVAAMDKAYQGKWTYTPIKKFELQTTIQQYKKLYHELGARK